MRLHQRKYFVVDAAAALIRGVQQVMSLLSSDVSKELRITFRNKDVVLRLVQLQHLVGLVEALCSQSTGILHSGDWLSSAPNAPTRAGHHFNQVVAALAGPHLLRDYARISQTVY